MKDAKGHGSNPRGSHAAGVESIPKGWGPIRLVNAASLKPRPENTAFLEKEAALRITRQKVFEAAYPGEKYTPSDPDMIEVYRQRIRNGETLSPLAVNRNRSIEDGEHRWRAYRAEGVKKIPVRVRQ